MATKGGKNDIVLDGQLNMTMILDNYKQIQKQVKDLRSAVNAAGDFPSRSNRKEAVKNQDDASFAIKEINRQLGVAGRSLKSYQNLLKNFQLNGKQVTDLVGRDRERYDQAVGGLINAYSGLKDSVKKSAFVLDELSRGKGASQQARDAYKALDTARNEAAKTLDDVTKSNKNATFAQQQLNKEKQQAKALAVEENRLQKARNQALKLRQSRQEASEKGRAVAGFSGLPVGALDAKQRADLRSALAAQAGIAKQREGIAVGRGDVSPETLSRLTAERVKAVKALTDYNVAVREQEKLEKQFTRENAGRELDRARAQRAADQAEAKRKKDEFKRINEGRILNPRRAENQAYIEAADREKKELKRINEGRVLNKQYAERLAYIKEEERVTKKLDDLNKGRVKDVETAERLARAEQVRRLNEGRVKNKELAQRKAIIEDEQRTREKFDELNRGRVQDAAYAERLAYVEKARLEKIAAKEEKRRMEKAAAAQQKIEKADRDERIRQEAAERKLNLSRAVATDVASRYGAGSPETLDLGGVSREEIGALKKYANEKVKIAADNIKQAQQQGRSTVELNRVYQGHVAELQRVEKAYRKLNHPLNQAALLFRQFFRFAIGYGALYQVLAAVTALGRGILDLDEKLKSIQAITESTDSQMVALERTIKRVAVTTKFSVAEVAQAAEILGQAGVDVRELPSALQATADFAAATSSSLEVAADLITTTRTVFKDLQDDTLADQLTRAVNISKLNADDLKTILSLSAQTADAFDLSSEQYLAAVTTLRNAGLKSSTVATGLRQALLEIFSPSPKAIKLIKQRYKQLGSDITEEAVRQRFFGFKNDDNPLLAVLSELKRLGFADEAQKDFERVFNVRASNAIKALINNYDELAAAESKLTFGAAAANGAETQMESLRNSLRQLGAAFTVFGDNVIGSGVGSLENYVDKITEAIKKLDELDTRLKLQGKSGISEALVPAGLGGFVGSLVGKTIPGRIAGAAAGVAAGSAASVGEGTTQAAGTVVLGAIGAGAILGYVKDAVTKLFAVVGKDAVGKEAGKAAARFGITRIAGGVAATLAGGWAVVGAAAAIWGVYEIYRSLFDDAGTEAQAAANIAEGRAKELSDLQAEYSRGQQVIQQFDISKARQGLNKGKAGEALVRFSKTAQEVSDTMDSLFGEVSEQKSKEIMEQLVEYSRAPLSRRRILGEELKENFQLDITGDEYDRVLSNFGNQIRELEDQGKANVQSFSAEYQKATEAVQKSLREGVDLGADDVNVQFLNLVDSNKTFTMLLRGQLEATSKVQAQAQEDLAQGLADINSSALAATTAKLAPAEKEDIRAKVKSAIADSEAAGSLSLENLLNNIVTSGVLIGKSAEDYLKLIDEVLREELKTLQDKFDEQSAELEDAKLESVTKDGGQGGRGARRLPSRGGVKTVSARRRKTSDQIAAVEAVLARKEEEAEAEKERKDKLILAQYNEDLAVLENARVQLKGNAGLDAAKRKTSGTTGPYAEFIAAVANSPEQLDGLITDLKAGFNPEDLEITAEDEVTFRRSAERQRAIVQGLKETNDVVALAEAGERELEELRANLPDVEDLIQKENLERDIRRIQGSNKSDRASLTNVQGLVGQLGEVRKRILTKELAVLGEELDGLVEARDRAALSPSEDGAQTPQDARRIVDLQRQRAEKMAELLDIDQDTVDQIEKISDDIERDRIRKAKEVAELNIDMANRWIELSGATADSTLFEEALATINSNRETLLKEIENELVIQGFGRGSPEFVQKLEAEKDKLRPINENFKEFIAALDTFFSGMRKQAELLRDKPVTLGFEQDALSQRQGTVGDERRFQEANNRRQANFNDIAANKGTVLALNKEISDKNLTGNDLAEAQTKIQGLNQETATLNQEIAFLTLTMMENSSVEEERNAALKMQMFNVQTLTEALQDSDYAIKNIAYSLNQTFVDMVDGVGDAIAQAVLNGENFIDVFGNMLLDIGRDLATKGIKTLVTEVALQGLNAVGASGAVSLLGIGKEAVSETVDTATMAASVTAALTPPTAALGTAGGALFTSAGALGTSAAALGSAALALSASATGGAVSSAAGSVVSSAGSALTSSAAGGGGNWFTSFLSMFGGGANTGGIMYPGKIKRYAKGTAGIISGPGSGTSDSIPAFHLDGKMIRPIMVANKESILTAKATEFLGPDFIHALNAGKISGFSEGAVMSRHEAVTSGAKVREPTSAAPANVTNKNETTIVNAIDSASLVSTALQTPGGQRAIRNYIRSDKSALQRILS